MLVDLLPGWDCWPPAPFPPHSHQDASDRAIISGNVNLIWAWASTVPTMPNGGSGWLPMHDNRGFMTLNLLGGAEVWQPLCLPFSLPCELPVVWWWDGGWAVNRVCVARWLVGTMQLAHHLAISFAFYFF